MSPSAATLFCQTADIIITGDTLPRSHHLLDLVNKNQCDADVVVELTNRFDWSYGNVVHEYDDIGGVGYFELIRNLTRDKGRWFPKLWWVVNNPWEDLYVFDRIGAEISARLIRPVGVSDVDPGDDYPGAMTKVAVHHVANNLEDLMKMHRIPYQRINNSYGGTIGLKRYKFYIEFPYQVATMKMYENIAAGVVTVVPSAKLFLTLVKNESLMFWPWGQNLGNHPDWMKYVEVYNPIFQPFMYYFNSFAELEEMSKMTLDELDAGKNVR
ncbi:hypothetical protein HDU76_001837, partial [Blyttiomyces sp. JEL0837]